MKEAREYFEKGCICILSEKIRKQGAEVDDSVAVAKYYDECKCSRHPEPRNN